MSFKSLMQRLAAGQPIIQKPRVVVEIGNRWLKAAHAAGGLKHRHVDRCRCIPIPEEKTGMKAAVGKLIEAMHFPHGEAILIIPRHLVTARMLRIPATNPDEVSRMVRLQAGRQTPYSKEEVMSGYRVVATDPQGYSLVLLAIVRRALIADRIEALEEAGVKTVGVGISTEGVITWFDLTRKVEEQATAVLNVDAGYSELAIFEYGTLVFTKAILIGASQVTANRAKWIPELTREVQTALQRYKTDSGGNNFVGRLFVAGALWDDNPLARLLGEQLRIHVDATDATRNLPLQSRRKTADTFESNKISPMALLGAALGETVPEADLLLPDLRISHTMDLRRRQLTVMGGLTIVLVSILSCLLLLGLYKRNLVLKDIDEEIARLKPEAERISGMRNQILLMQSRLDARRRPVALLAELHDITPENIRLTGLSIEAGRRMSLQGSARQTSQVLAYVDLLEDSEYFTNVKTTYTSQKEVEGQEFAEFQISCLYEDM